ncbi:hypothetical protein D3C75_758080 [compost metagenome]
MQICPLKWNAAVTAPAAATSSGACLEMISGSLPPASITQGFIRSAQATATALPAATLPVKATAWVCADCTSNCAVTASPGTQDTSPGSNAVKCSMNLRVHRVVASAGLMMQALPAAKDAATVQHISRIGKLNGMMCTLTP